MLELAYAVLSATFLLAWVACYVGLRESRPAIFWTALIFASAGPIGEFWLLGHYWRPVYLVELSIGSWTFGIEDYVVTFAFGGLSAALFEVVARKLGMPAVPPVAWRTLLRMTGWACVGLVLILFFIYAVGLQPIYGCVVAVAVTALLLLARDRDLIRIAFPVALVTGVMVWLFYVALFLHVYPDLFEAFWNEEASLGTVVGVPIEEMLWAASTTFFAGPVYRACSR